MTDRVTFVGTYAIPKGGFSEWSAAIKDMTDFVSANAERLISFDTYVDEERSEGTTIYVHPDTASLEQHLRLAASRINAGSAMVEVLRIELYGSPSEMIVERLRQMSRESTGYPVTVKQHFYGSLVASPSA